MKYIEITIVAPLPDDNHEIGHEAVVATKEAVLAVVEALDAMGITAKATRHIVNRKVKAVEPETPVAVAEAA